MSDSTSDHQRISEFLRRYWDTLRGSRPLPLESEINMDALKEVWDSCFLVNAKDGRFAYAYLGEQLFEAYGDDITGKEIATTLLEPHPNSLLHNFRKARETASPCEDHSEFTNSRGVLIKYRACVLPFGAHGHEGVAFLLGGMKWKLYDSQSNA